MPQQGQYFYEKQIAGSYLVYYSQFGANKTIVCECKTIREALTKIDRLYANQKGA